MRINITTTKIKISQLLIKLLDFFFKRVFHDILLTYVDIFYVNRKKPFTSNRMVLVVLSAKNTCVRISHVPLGHIPWNQNRKRFLLKLFFGNEGEHNFQSLTETENKDLVCVIYFLF